VAKTTAEAHAKAPSRSGTGPVGFAVTAVSRIRMRLSCAFGTRRRVEHLFAFYKQQARRLLGGHAVPEESLSATRSQLWHGLGSKRLRHTTIQGGQEVAMNVKISVGCALLVGILSFGGNALAQQAGLVNVNVSGITVVLADVLDVEENQIPLTVQAPINVAAQVCGTTVGVLVQEIRGSGNADCDATQTSEAFNRFVAREIGG
jgi:hypothetical protein